MKWWAMSDNVNDDRGNRSDTLSKIDSTRMLPSSIIEQVTRSSMHSITIRRHQNMMGSNIERYGGTLGPCTHAI